MIAAVGRSGGPAVATLVTFLTAGPPVRSTAQSQASVLVVLPGSTRSAGLGGAGAALVGDAGAIFANPAGIATIRRLSLEGSYERHLGGTTLSSAALALRAGRVGWGFGIAALDTASATPFNATNVLGVSTLVLRTSVVALGGSAKYARQSGGASAVDAWAGDVGLAIAIFDIAALGVSVQNLGGDLGNGTRLPRRTRAGFTMNYVDPQGTLRLLTTLEGQWLQGRAAVLVAGAEGGVVARGVGLVGRVGARGGGGGGGGGSWWTGSPAGGAAAVTLGGGVELGRLHVDYAYLGRDVSGQGTHRFGVRWTP